MNTSAFGTSRSPRCTTLRPTHGPHLDWTILRIRRISWLTEGHCWTLTMTSEARTDGTGGNGRERDFFFVVVVLLVHPTLPYGTNQRGRSL